MVSLMATKKKRPRGRPPGVEKIRVNLKLPPELDTSIYEAAGKLGLTKSAWVERAARAQLERDNAN